jgi:cyclophilin family peptidyl-prolyl cis-trans isomerase
MNKRISFALLLLLIITSGIFIMINNDGNQSDLSEKKSVETVSSPTQKMQRYTQPPNMQIDSSKNYKALIKTSQGDIAVDLTEKMTPVTVNNFVFLAKEGFYDNTIFHRIIEGFMIQGGDPLGNGTGNPGYKFDDEEFQGKYNRGTLAMANSGPNTNGSQFFIMHQDNQLPPDYVIFGNVIEGIEVVDKIVSQPVKANMMGEKSVPITPDKIISIDIIEE